MYYPCVRVGYACTVRVFVQVMQLLSVCWDLLQNTIPLAAQQVLDVGTVTSHGTTDVPIRLDTAALLFSSQFRTYRPQNTIHPHLQELIGS